MSQLSEALEMAMCAQANLENIKKSAPMIAAHPYFQIVEMQIAETVEILERTP